MTSTAGVEHGGVTADDPGYPVQREYRPASSAPRSATSAGSTCGGTLFVILQESCNTAFAQMGVENAAADGMTDSAEAFGFNHDVPLDLPGGVQSRPADSRQPLVARTRGMSAQASIGQNEVPATPLQMAMVAGAVANGGEIMGPHVMREVRDDQGNVVDEYDPEVWTTRHVRPTPPTCCGTR